MVAAFTWGDFLFISLCLIASYFLLQFIQKLLENFKLFGRFQNRVRRTLHSISLIYELLVLLVLGGVFLLINPPFHGGILAVLLIGGFTHLRNYISGRIIQFDTSMTRGARLQTAGKQGIISSLDRLGLKLRMNKGLHFINYSQLMEEGYTLQSGEEVGGFYELKINAPFVEDRKDYSLALMDLLQTAPYIDGTYKPEIIVQNEHPNQMTARLLVKEENHLKDLLQLIEEWGYSCKIAKK